MDNKDLQIVEHIRRYCKNIYASIKRYGNSFEVFSEDTDFYQSVSMSLQQIGTLSGSLSDSFRNASKERIPWRMIINMRNRFAHGYETMNKDIIWETAIEDIPNLHLFCEEVVEKHLNQQKIIENNSDKDQVNVNPSYSPRLKP